MLLRYRDILNFLLKYSMTVCGVFTKTEPAGNDRANAPKEEFCRNSFIYSFFKQQLTHLILCNVVQKSLDNI
jgi:hypothetical protein